MSKDEQLSITKYDLLYESRMSKAEAAMENFGKSLDLFYAEIKEMRHDMKTDFRWLLGMMLAIVGLMAHGFHWF